MFSGVHFFLSSLQRLLCHFIGSFFELTGEEHRHAGHLFTERDLADSGLTWKVTMGLCCSCYLLNLLMLLMAKAVKENMLWVSWLHKDLKTGMHFMESPDISTHWAQFFAYFHPLVGIQTSSLLPFKKNYSSLLILYWRWTGKDKNFVYSRLHPSVRHYDPHPKPIGLGFGGSVGNERIFIDEDFSRVTVRHHAVDKTYKPGPLYPNQVKKKKKGQDLGLNCGQTSKISCHLSLDHAADEHSTSICRVSSPAKLPSWRSKRGVWAEEWQGSNRKRTKEENSSSQSSAAWLALAIGCRFSFI